MTKTFTTSTLIVTLMAAAWNAEGQTGGPYTVQRSVIATGGNTTGGGQFTVTGTAGQNVAGSPSASLPFDTSAGFWASPEPAAPVVTAGGRVLDLTGHGVGNVKVILITSAGTRTVNTNSFGIFRFDDIPSGDTLILNVRSKRYRFSPATATYTLVASKTDILFSALE